MINPVDQKILDRLQSDGRIPYSSIAKEIGLTPTAIGQRVQKMVQDETIKGFSVHVNPERLGIHIQAIITLKLHFSKVEAFYKAYKRFEEIQFCYRVTGDDCMILLVHLKNNAHLVKFIDKISDYGSSKTSIIIDELQL